MDIWYIFCLIGTFSPALVSITEKNLAILNAPKPDLTFKSSLYLASSRKLSTLMTSELTRHFRCYVFFPNSKLQNVKFSTVTFPNLDLLPKVRKVKCSTDQMFDKPNFRQTKFLTDQTFDSPSFQQTKCYISYFEAVHFRPGTKLENAEL
jgi:hypothetical protein